jgi:GT2 family glycosyltransferase
MHGRGSRLLVGHQAVSTRARTGQDAAATPRELTLAGSRLSVASMEQHRSSPVTTVVASRNRRVELLATLDRHTRPVILVDNASTDGTPDAVAAACPDVRVVRESRNLGATARNIGVELADTPYVAFADDDSWWQPGALELAVKILDDHPRVGLLAARILLGVDEAEDPVCLLMEHSPLRAAAGEPGTPVLGFVACAAVVRRDAFLAAGGFDPVVFFAGEEARLAIDLAADGWQLCYLPSLVVHHHPSPHRESNSSRDALVARNDLLTAVMRRPWSAVLRIVFRALRRPAGRRGIVRALPRLQDALAARRRIPVRVEQRLRQLGH